MTNSDDMNGGRNSFSSNSSNGQVSRIPKIRLRPGVTGFPATTEASQGTDRMEFSDRRAPVSDYSGGAIIFETDHTRTSNLPRAFAPKVRMPGDYQGQHKGGS